MHQLGGPLAAALNRQLLRDSALSTADYEVLVVLSETPSGVLRAGELGRATGWEKSRLSHHLKRMVARGLVERRGCVTDGRGLMVAITPHGLSTIEKAAPGHVGAVREYVIDLLTPAQLEVLAEVGEAVGARLAAENCAAAAEDCSAAAEDRSPAAEDRSAAAEDRSPAAEDRSPAAEDSGRLADTDLISPTVEPAAR